MDLVAEEERELILDDRKRLIEESCVGVGVQHFQCFGTSIWDETLYKAWSEIVTNLVPNIGVLESHLSDFCRICDADEVVLFERATFLVISHAQAKKDTIDDGGKQRQQSLIKSGDEGDNENKEDTAEDAGGGGDDDAVVEHQMSTSPNSTGTPPINNPTPSPPGSPGGNIKDNQQLATKGASSNQISSSSTPQFDAHRFEKISNIVKQFKLSCGKAQSQFQGMDVCNSKFTAFIDAFTPNTYIMVIVSNTGPNSQDWGHGTRKAATLMNIQKARSHFAKDLV